MRVVTQSSAPEDRVRTTFGQLVIRARDVPVVGGRRRPSETVADIIHPVSRGNIIWVREGVEITEYHGVWTDLIRIHAGRILDLISVECVVARGNGMRGGQSLNSAARASGRVGTQITDNSVAQGIAGHDAQNTVLLALAITFIVEEEEEAIFLQRTSHGRAEDIANQLQRFVGLAITQLRLLHEPVVGAGESVAVVLVQRSVKSVGAALGDERDLRSGGAALVRVVVRGSNAEFLD